MKAHGDVDARVHIFIATALGWGRVASPMLGRLYPRGNPQYSFYRRLSGPQDQSGHEGEKKSPPLRHPGSNLGHPACSQAPCHLSHQARTTFMYLQYSCHPCISHFANIWKMLYTISTSIFVDVPYWLPPYSTDKFISCVVPGPLQWFFHFGKEIVIAWTQEKTTIGGTEPHHSSWQCKESHHCCHGPLAPLAMGDSGTPTLLTRYGSLRQSERTTARDQVQHRRCSCPCYRAVNTGTSTKFVALMVYGAYWIFGKRWYVRGRLYWRYINVAPLWIKPSHIQGVRNSYYKHIGLVEGTE